ncbi:hypothetical protein KSP40_PGU019539 [Platanthera guangdongensis]|uniref:FG-GAP repeat-containing protein n=1 Tax=Platanthera guangdongensis TaxID=2320717 RepID=A0ABR2MKU7_9ASPA
MRKRDLGILMLAAFAIFFSLKHEGDLSFKEAWFHITDEYPIKYEAERLPPPIVADLNGDGKSEVLVATHDAKIQVLDPHGIQVDEGFSEARILAEVSLLPDKIRISSGRRPVAMAAGYVDRSYKHGEIRKQVLVVVTSGWSVMCFDHNLKKLWENNLQEDFPHGAHHSEIAITISNFTLKHGDAGLVIIGGRMEMKHHTMDFFEENLLSDKTDDLNHRNASEKRGSGNGVSVDLRHFAFYAFGGRSGTIRWTRKNENVQVEPSDASRLIPQHNYKLDAHALNSRHPGEFECREFRESILGVMPHRWDRREDTSLELSHFIRHKRKLLKKMSGKPSTSALHKPVENNPPGKDSSNKIARAIGKAASYAGSAKQKKRHLYFPTITNHTQLWWVPNVAVAHHKEGIEAVHLASGRTICKLHLPEGGLHADINGDGVLDHVQVVGRNSAESTVVTGSMEVLRPCMAVATSGVPVREQLFNASICHHSHFNIFQHSDFTRSFGRTVDSSSVEVATPVLLHKDDGHKHKRSHGDIIFLTSHGQIYSTFVVAWSLFGNVFSSRYPLIASHPQAATWSWSVTTGLTRALSTALMSIGEATVVPTLRAFSLRAHSREEVIIAAGDHEAVVISPGGSLLASIELPGSPTHTLILEDFSGDGFTDIILVTSGGVYGFVLTRQPGALFFSTLVGCLLIIMGVIFVSQHLNSMGKAKPRASGDSR